MGGSLVWVARSREVGPKLKKAVAAKMGDARCALVEALF